MVLVSLGVLADALTAADDVIEGDVHQAPVEVDVADLQTAQLPAAHARDHQPQVQPQSGVVRRGLGDLPWPHLLAGQPGCAGGWWVAWLTRRGSGWSIPTAGRRRTRRTGCCGCRGSCWA
jgi:hypothetical protein